MRNLCSAIYENDVEKGENISYGAPGWLYVAALPVCWCQREKKNIKKRREKKIYKKVWHNSILKSKATLETVGALKIKFENLLPGECRAIWIPDVT